MLNDTLKSCSTQRRRARALLPKLSVMRVCAEMLIAGVAFQQDGKTWSVYSHEGDELGEMSTYWVSATVCAMKKLGWKVNGLHPDMYGKDPAITLGHHPKNKWLIAAIDWDALMKRRNRKVVTIH